MRHKAHDRPSRRNFLGGAVAIVGALPLAAVASAASPNTVDAGTGAIGAAARYRWLTPAEAAFVETMVTSICPADELTPDGVSSGLAASIDAQLTGGVGGRVDGRPELFRAGIAAADASCRARLGAPFHQLPVADARQFLRDIAAGEVDADLPLMSWSSDVVDPLLKQACFSGPVYDRFGSRMFVKLFG